MNRQAKSSERSRSLPVGEAELRAAFAARLVQARTRRRLSQKELAARLGGDPSALSRCERGLALPTCLTLLRMAEALDVSTDFLLTGRHFPSGRPASGEIARRLEALAGLSPDSLNVLLPFLDCLAQTLRQAEPPKP